MPICQSRRPTAGVSQLSVPESVAVLAATEMSYFVKRPGMSSFSVIDGEVVLVREADIEELIVIVRNDEPGLFGGHEPVPVIGLHVALADTDQIVPLVENLENGPAVSINLQPDRLVRHLDAGVAHLECHRRRFSMDTCRETHQDEGNHCFGVRDVYSP